MHSKNLWILVIV